MNFYSIFLLATTIAIVKSQGQAEPISCPIEIREDGSHFSNCTGIVPPPAIKFISLLSDWITRNRNTKNGLVNEDKTNKYTALEMEKVMVTHRGQPVEESNTELNQLPIFSSSSSAYEINNLGSGSKIEPPYIVLESEAAFHELSQDADFGKRIPEFNNDMQNLNLNSTDVEHKEAEILNASFLRDSFAQGDGDNSDSVIEAVVYQPQPPPLPEPILQGVDFNVDQTSKDSQFKQQPGQYVLNGDYYLGQEHANYVNSGKNEIQNLVREFRPEAAYKMIHEWEAKCGCNFV